MSKYECNKHTSRHAAENPYKCDECDKSFIVNWEFENHNCTHKTIKKTAQLLKK